MTATRFLSHVPAVMVLVLLAGSALGQPASEKPDRSPHTNPVLNDPGIDRDLRTRDRVSDPVMPSPVKPPQRTIPSVPAPVADAPGLSGTDFSLPKRQKYPEGTFIPSSPGRLIKARTGDVIFVADTRGDLPPEPPMVLLQSQRLSQIDAAMSSPSFSGRATVGGQVFVYRDRHYLLPTVFAALSSDQPAEPTPSSTSEPEESSPSEPATQPSSKQPETPPSPATDPRVEDLIKDLEAQRSVPRALTPNPDPAAQQVTKAPERPGADARTLTPEGTVLVFRRGRLVRLNDEGGRIAFAFDNDPNSPGPGPMIIQPCAQLQRLESLVATRGDAIPLKASGRVLTYQGRNYLLPTFVQVVGPSEVVPMQ